MKCFRYIKYKHIQSVRKRRRLYVDDKGIIHTLDQAACLRHEQRKIRPKGDSRRRGIYG